MSQGQGMHVRRTPGVLSATLLVSASLMLAFCTGCNVSRETGTFEPPDSTEDAGEDGTADIGDDTGVTDTKPTDTGLADTGPMCGDGMCEAGENCGECPEDCTCSANRTCEMNACLCDGEPCEDFGEECCVTGCEDLEVDKQNCGGCGNVCDPTEDCQDGVCRCGAVACAMGEACCADACIDLDANTEHCGACGNACNPGEVCVDGQCACEGNGAENDACDPGVVCCNGLCCGTDEQCCSGTCALASDAICQCGSSGACTASEICCPQGDPSAECYDPATSTANCGACGNTCRDDQVCSGSTCTCPSGEKECNGTCIPSDSCCSNAECDGDLVCATSGDCECPPSSPKLCGSSRCIAATGCCSNAECTGDLTCIDDDCRCPAATPIECSGAQCIASGCCDNGGCAGDLVCENNSCDCPNSAPKECPSNRCIASGGCCSNSDCSGGKVCQSDDQCRCPSGETDCSGTCRDTDTNDNHCGACGNTCGANASCVNGQCQCAAGWGNCDGNFATNGCEVDLSSNLTHCGTCGNACSGPATCDDGSCALGDYFEVTGAFNEGATPRVTVLQHDSLVVSPPSGGTHNYAGGWIDSNGASGNTTGSLTLAANNAVTLSTDGFGFASARGDIIVTTRDDVPVQAIWLRRGESGFSASDLTGAWQNAAYVGLRSQDANDGWVRGFRGIIWFDGSSNITTDSNQSWTGRNNNSTFTMTGSATISNNGAVTLSTNRGTWRGYMGEHKDTILLTKRASGNLEPAYMIMYASNGIPAPENAALNGTYFINHLIGDGTAGSGRGLWGDVVFNGSGGITGGELYDTNDPTTPGQVCSSGTYSLDGGGYLTGSIVNGDMCQFSGTIAGRVQDDVNGICPTFMGYNTGKTVASMQMWIRKQ